ncbi:MAG: patatin-like phospholipase family protein [Alphaproteobacteria bacterium]
MGKLARFLKTMVEMVPGFRWFKPGQGPTTRRRRVNVALQGGGALGAFTWGVLDRLLESRHVRITAASGASAGAMNATLLASGLVRGGPEAARARLEGFWRDAARAGSGPMGQSGMVRAMTALFNPALSGGSSETNLRQLVDRHVDITALCDSASVPLVIAATDLKTEQAELFRNADITLPVLMASACLPLLHRPVEINGRLYVDGGLSLNPPLLSLIEESPADETLLIRILPTGIGGESARPFAQAMDSAQMLFNRGLIGELDQYHRLKKLSTEVKPAPDTLLARIQNHRLSQIDGAAHMPLGTFSQALNPNMQLVETLFRLGRNAAEAWLATDARERAPDV